MFDRTDKVIVSFLGALLIFLVVLTFAQVIMRYVFDSPLTWAEEFIGIVMIYFGLIGGSWGIKRGIHIALEVFVQKYLKKLQSVANVLEILSYFAVGIFEIVYGIKIVILSKYAILPATGIKASYVYMAIPIAGVVMIFFSVEKIMKLLKR